MKKIIILIFLSLFVISCSDKEELDKSPKSKTILALWDSLTAWYWVSEEENYPYKLWKKLEENWYNYKIINAWISWDTSEDLKLRAANYIDENPEILLLVIWWNDWLRRLDTENMKKNISEIIEIFEKNWTKIVLWWIEIPANFWVNYRNNFINVYKEIAKEKEKIYFLESFLGEVAGNRNLNLDDLIHPNPSWYDIIVENLYDFLIKNKLLRK